MASLGKSVSDLADYVAVKQTSLILLQTTPKFLDHDKLKLKLSGVRIVHV